MSQAECEKLVEKLNKRGFYARYFSKRDEAKSAILNEVGPHQTVGVGGSMTIFEMGIHEDLAKRGNEIFWHWLVDPEQRDEVRQRAAKADIYLCSSNAITSDGALVNIDGTGNRVSAMFYGPKKVIVVCGENKIAGDYDSAIDRIKKVACPQNARRLKLKTPCALTGECHDCKGKDRMCNVMVTLERPPHGVDIHVYMVGEPLGF